MARISVPSLHQALLDLRDAREQLETLKTYGEEKFAAETRLTEQLKIAVEALARKDQVIADGLAGEADTAEQLKIAVEVLERNRFDDCIMTNDPAKRCGQCYSCESRTALDRIKGIG